MFTKYLVDNSFLLPNLDAPATIHEALNNIDGENKKEALNEKYNSLMKNNIWILADLPPGQSTVSCKWISKRK